MPLEFVSTNPTIESALLDILVKPNLNVKNSVLTGKTPPIAPTATDIYNVEWQPGSSLNKIAQDYLGNSFAWTIIADANGLDPTKPIDIGKVLKVPTVDRLQKSVTKILIEDPRGKKLITDIKQSVLNLVGISNNDSQFSKSLRECIDKVISFKIS